MSESNGRLLVLFEWTASYSGEGTTTKEVETVTVPVLEPVTTECGVGRIVCVN
jgi:hypothetical protein